MINRCERNEKKINYLVIGSFNGVCYYVFYYLLICVSIGNLKIYTKENVREVFLF